MSPGEGFFYLIFRQWHNHGHSFGATAKHDEGNPSPLISRTASLLKTLALFCGSWNADHRQRNVPFALKVFPVRLENPRRRTQISPSPAKTLDQLLSGCLINLISLLYYIVWRCWQHSRTHKPLVTKWSESAVTSLALCRPEGKGAGRV